MGNRVSQRSVAFDGIPISTRVGKDVGRAIIAEALRCNRSAGHVAESILLDWYEVVYLPAQKAKA